MPVHRNPTPCAHPRPASSFSSFLKMRGSERSSSPLRLLQHDGIRREPPRLGSQATRAPSVEVGYRNQGVAQGLRPSPKALRWAFRQPELPTLRSGAAGALAMDGDWSTAKLGALLLPDDDSLGPRLVEKQPVMLAQRISKPDSSPIRQASLDVSRLWRLSADLSLPDFQSLRRPAAKRGRWLRQPQAQHAGKLASFPL